MEKTIKRIILCVCFLIGGMSANAQFVTFKNGYEVEAAIVTNFDYKADVPGLGTVYF